MQHTMPENLGMTEKAIHLFFSDITIYLSKLFTVYIKDFLIV